MRDLQLELSVLKAIKAREDVLDRLKVGAGRQGWQAAWPPILAHLLYGCLVCFF